MNEKVTYLRKVNYGKYLTEDIPLVDYKLYECGTHRFAYLSFLNQERERVISFTIRVVCFDKESNSLGEFTMKFTPKNFSSHYYYHPSDPLILPLECEGFNYSIEDIETVKEESRERNTVKINYIPDIPVTAHPKHSTRPLSQVLLLSTLILVFLSLLYTFLFYNPQTNGYGRHNDSSSTYVQQQQREEKNNPTILGSEEEGSAK